MTTPEEIIEDWEKQVKNEKDKDMLESIKQDLEMELNDYENIVSRYESLIEKIEDVISGDYPSQLDNTKVKGKGEKESK